MACPSSLTEPVGHHHPSLTCAHGGPKVSTSSQTLCQVVLCLHYLPSFPLSDPQDSTGYGLTFQRRTGKFRESKEIIEREPGFEAVWLWSQSSHLSSWIYRVFTRHTPEAGAPCNLSTGVVALKQEGLHRDTTSLARKYQKKKKKKETKCHT